MSNEAPTRSDSAVYDPDLRPELFDAILSKRVVAFVVDAIIIVLLMIPAALVVFIVGVVTFGIGWLLYGALFAIVALGYKLTTQDRGRGGVARCSGNERLLLSHVAERIPQRRHGGGERQTRTRP